MKKKIIIGIVVLLVAIQFVPIKKNVSEETSNQFLVATSASNEISNILEVSCFDCHSNNTVYPWYNNIAPVSWFLKRHIDEGKEHLNFSAWDGYDAKKKHHKLDECVEMIEKDEMPLSSYTLIHKDAKLSQEQQDLLIGFFKAEMSKIAQ